MVIQVDAEGKNAVQQLCDIALKDGGIGNLNQVNVILRSVTVLPTPEDEEPEEKIPGEEEPEEEEPKKELKEDEVGKN